LRLSGGLAETGIAILSFGGSSVYWLALAFAMSPAAYGAMMTLQAAVLIVVMIFTFRTHDLFFNLIAKHGLSADVAYRRTLKIELAAGAAGALICTLIALASEPTGGGWVGAAGFAAFALLASLGVIHGASIGKLRYLTRNDVISRTDVLTALGWVAACASIPLIYRQSAIVPLIVGSVPPAMRTLALFISVRRVLPRRDAATSGEAPAVEVGSGQILRFLAGAQVTNFIKNGAVSIETLILAAFTPPPVVAMFRVARAAQGASNAALNVAYQRSYPILARATDGAERLAAARRLGVRSFWICCAIYPLAVLASLAYALFKPEIGVIELQLLTLGTFLTLLPGGALQQGSIALLLIDGDHRSVGTAYLLSLMALGLTALAMAALPRVEVFVAGLIGAALLRMWYLNRRSHKVAMARSA
jgi:hypothetical protein